MKKKIKQFQRRFRKWKKNFLIRNTVVTIILTIWTLSGSIPFIDNVSLNPFFHEAEAAEADVDATASTTQTEHTGASPSLVVVSNTNAYSFYVDSGGQCVYSKTTNLNAATPTWGAAVQVDSQTDCTHIAVWYDRWTPGDNTGNYIHIITTDIGNDDLWYNRLDVSTDTRLLTASPVSISSAPAPAVTSGITDAGTLPTITKSTTGVIYAGVIDGNASYVHKCSTTCNTGGNWTAESPDFETATYALNDNDTMILMPQPGGDIMLIDYHDATDDVIYKIYDETGDTWSSFVAVDASGQNNTTYDGAIGATIDRSTYEIYIAYGAQIATIGTDDDVRTALYNPVTATWTLKTDAITNLAITGAKIAMDESSGTIYAVYTRRTTAATATTGNVYYKTSTDKMTTWSAESTSLVTTPDDLYGARVPILTNEHMYATWYDLAADDINGNTIADLTPITSSIEQAVYRFFDNTNTTDVGSALALSNTAPTLTSKGQAFRLRMLLKVTTANLATSGQQFKLQFTNKNGGACSSASLVWEDVNGSTRISYNNNATPTDGSALTANANDPTNGGDTIVNQTYEETNAFTNSQAAVNTGQNGKWDFSLYDANGVGGATYCFRVVKNGGDSLDTFTVYPEVTIAANPTYTQSNFRIYANADSADVGAANAAQNANYALVNYDEAIRVRMLVGLSGTGMALNGISMKLQFADKGVGSCSAPTGSYADVTTATVLAYNNNATPADGAALTSNANDPTSSNTIRKQTYEEANNFSNTQLAIAAGEDALWDFSLIDLDMAANTTYCLRIVQSDGTALNTYSQYPEITSLGGSIDRTPNATGSNHLSTSPTTVFTSDQVGYTFYMDSTGIAVYRKTSNGGTTWGNAVTVDSQTDVVNIAVWYDRWTPGDTSGNIIHIVTADSGNDDLWYTQLNTSGDTLSTPVSTVVTVAQSGTYTTAQTHASITKGTTGTIYMGVNDSSDVFVMECSATCTTGSNWTESGTLGFPVGEDSLILMPLASGDLMAINWDKSASSLLSRVMTDAGNTWSGTTTIDAVVNDNTTYSSAMGATLNKTTNAIYLTIAQDAETLGTNDDVNVYTYSGGSWAANTDVISGDARGLTDAKIAIDENNSQLYAVYTVRTTAATATTGTIYYKTSSDGGSTWGSEQGPVSYASGDIYGARTNIMSSERIYLTYVDDTTDTFSGATIADLSPPLPAYTQPAYVQSAINASLTSLSATSVTLGSAVTAGNLIVVAVSLWNAVSEAYVTSVTDNKGNNYQLAFEDPTGQNGGTEPLAVYYAYNVAGGSSFQVTVNTGTSAVVTVAATEYSGIATINPLDRTSDANAIGAASTAGDSGTPAETTTDYQLVYGACNHQDVNTTATAGTNFTMRAFSDENNTSEVLYTEDRVVTSKGQYPATMTFADARQWRCGVATFKAADSPPNNDQLMRHGGFFNNNGAEHKFTF